MNYQNIGDYVTKINIKYFQGKARKKQDNLNKSPLASISCTRVPAPLAIVYQIF